MFPGIVSVEAGVSVAVPELLLMPDQNVVVRLALSNVKVAGMPVPPFSSHVSVMLETITSIYGFVIVILITFVLSVMLILLAVIVSQLDDGVDVPVGVGVDVASGVLVAVGELGGIKVGVLLGRGVIVTTWTRPVAVGVADSTVAVAVAVGVSEGTVVPGVVGAPEVAVFGARVGRSSRSR